MESAVAGSDEVGSAVVGLSAGTGLVNAGLFITNLIFGAGVPVGGALATLTHFWRAKGAISSLSFGGTRTRHCRVVVVVLVAMAVRTKFSRFFLMGFC